MYPKQSKYLTKIYNRLDSRLYQIWFDHSEQSSFDPRMKQKLKMKTPTNIQIGQRVSGCVCCRFFAQESPKKSLCFNCWSRFSVGYFGSLDEYTTNRSFSFVEHRSTYWTRSSSNNSSFEHCTMRAINKSTTPKLSFPFRCCAATTTTIWRFKSRRVREKLSLNSLYEWHVNWMLFLLRSSTRSIAHLTFFGQYSHRLRLILDHHRSLSPLSHVVQFDVACFQSQLDSNYFFAALLSFIHHFFGRTTAEHLPLRRVSWTTLRKLEMENTSQ